MQPFDPLTFAGMLARHVAERPDMVVLTIESGAQTAEQTRTYAQLWSRGAALAALLQGLGVRRGETVAALMANHAEFVDLMLACSLVGAVLVPIDPRTRGDKLQFMLDFAQVRGVVACDYALTGLQEVRPRVMSIAWVLGIETDEPGLPSSDWDRERVVSLDGALRQVIVPADFSGTTPDEPLELIYTSGTTGDPKAIVMTHRRYCEGCLASPRALGYDASDGLYSGLSLTHANAQLITLGAALAAAIPCVLSRRFTKSRLWDITRKYGCTTFTLLGGMTTALYAERPRPNDAQHPVRRVISAGMPGAIWADFSRRFNVEICEFYGAAEGGLTINPPGVGPVGSIGKPAPSLQYRIVDEHGRDCPPGQPGELLFRPADGSAAQVAYWRNTEASAIKCHGGWLHMGDVVRVDEQGWLYFLYRRGSNIRRNGDFINPAFVEKAIAESPDIDDVFVYGLPQPGMAPGEKEVVAAVVPRDPQLFDAQALFRWCSARLDANAVPSFLQVIPALPKTASEKPQERFLIEAFARHPEQIVRATTNAPARGASLATGDMS